MNTWTVAIGVVGGLLSGLMSDSKHVWPKLIDVGRSKPLPCVGLVGNAVIGMAAAELLSLTVFRGGDVSSTAAAWLHASTQLLFSFLASSAIRGYTDSRFLRLAIRNAAMAPAADPATVRALEVATPCEAYVATTRLAPPLSSIWGSRREPFIATAHDGDSRELSVLGSRTPVPVRLVRVATRTRKKD